MFADATNRRILLLQGPMGPFFRRVGEELHSRGAYVSQVAFNAGDELFLAGCSIESYRGDLAAWPRYVEELIVSRRIDSLALFGDRRPYHAAAIKVAKALGIQVWVFEEGYLRPHHITLERNGSNARSEMPTDAQDLGGQALPSIVGEASGTFVSVMFYSIVYVLALRLGTWRYPHYQHHRDVRAISSGLKWIRGAFRKLWYGLTERQIERQLRTELNGRFFLAPLQVHCDSQVADSQFADVEGFIHHAVDSFARAADPDHTLVLKHHPLDRAYTDYTRVVEELAITSGLGDRLRYVHDLDLPTLLRNARGTVVMNSTVGLSSLFHGTPTKALDRAIYNLDGLTHQGVLDDFWHISEEVDRELFDCLRRWLLANNQFNGSFYRRLPGMTTPTGVRWDVAQNLSAE